MQNAPGVRQIAHDRLSRLPWLAPPAGYVILIQDLAYGNRYKIARHQQLDRHLMRRGADFPFETRVARILEAENAAVAEQDLHDKLAAGVKIGEWFDLEHVPQDQPSRASHQESVSLRDLAQNDMDAESLLQDSNIVGTTTAVSLPQTAAPRVQRTTRRRRPRVMRWAFLLGLIVLVGVLVAERSGDIQRVIDSILDESPRGANSRRSVAPSTESGATTARSASPTPTIEGKAEVFYLKTRGRVRTCPNLSCRVFEVLIPGTKITAIKYVSGQRINGSDRWIAFVHRSQQFYIHSSVLSKTWPIIESSPTTKPTRIKATAEGQGQVFYVVAEAHARHCARLSCEALEILPRGTKITAIRTIKGQRINGSDLWIRFSYNRRHLSIHSSNLTQVDPNAESLPTAQAASEERATSTTGKTYYVKSRARPRKCPRLTCDVAEVFEIGTPITATGYLRGDPINSNVRWIAFSHNGRNLYLHSSLLTKEAPTDEPTTAPSPTAQPTQRNQSTTASAQQLFVKDSATVYGCANTRCQAIDVLERGTKVSPSGHWHGQRINGSNQWLRIRHEDQTVYLHSSYVSEEETVADPTAQPSATDLPTATETATSSATEPPSPTTAYTATDPPTPTATEFIQPTETSPVILAAKYVVETARNLNANIRACPRTNCDIVAKFPAGTAVEVVGSVSGETVYGTDVWLEISLDGGSAFIHSELVADAG